MVYTVTLNPALDYVMKLKALRTDDINRTDGEEIYYGGKGINVSVILTQLGIPNTALGFLGGFTGKKLEEMLKNDNVSCDFNYLKNGDTRINVKIKADKEIDLNACGPEITKEDAGAAALLTWSRGVENGRVVWTCDVCTRRHARSIEGKLDSAWW